jgi:hypothetical protein
MQMPSAKLSFLGNSCQRNGEAHNQARIKLNSGGDVVKRVGFEVCR